MNYAERAEIVARTAFAREWEQLAHTTRVVTQLHKLSEVTDEEVAVAWLHDVIEDSPVDYVDLVDMGFSRPIVDAVSYITRDGIYLQDYDAYKTRLFEASNRAGRMARRVKLADARENLERCKLAYGVPKWQRLADTRYAPLVAALEARLGLEGPGDRVG